MECGDQHFRQCTPGRSGLTRLVLITALLSGCQTAAVEHRVDDVSNELVGRFGVSVIETTSATQPGLPPGVVLDDGLSETESVQVALWNNAAFQEMLAALGLTQAQLLDAGLISDPQFSIFFPLGPKQLEFTAFQAVDVLWLQPIRVRAAELDLDRVSQILVQNGLDVIRDVRVAHASLLLAQGQAEAARQAESLRRQIAELAQKRLDAGDISELEATAVRIDALQAQALAGRASQDVRIARQQLLTLIGQRGSPESHIQNSELLAVASRDADLSAALLDSLDSLLDAALTMRPDLRAAEISIEAAGERVGLAQKQFMNLDAVYDANGSGNKGFESGPGLRFTIPVFNRNRGGIAIADAQWQQAARQYVTVRDRVTLEVSTAHTQLEQAQQNLHLLRTEILPTLQLAEGLARRNYENGGAPYFLVLQTTSQYLDSRMRELQLEADVRRALAELERGVGKKIQTSPDASGRLPEPGIESVQSVQFRTLSVLYHASEVESDTADAVRPVRHPSDSTYGSSRTKGWHATTQ